MDDQISVDSSSSLFIERNDAVAADFDDIDTPITQSPQSVQSARSSSLPLTPTVAVSRPEQLAIDYVDATMKVQRLQKLLKSMEELRCFDCNDMERVQQEMGEASRLADAIQASVSEEEWKLVSVFVTLKTREWFFEQAVSNSLLLVDKDAALFQGFVKKEVYLTRLANEALQ